MNDITNKTTPLLGNEEDVEEESFLGDNDDNDDNDDNEEEQKEEDEEEEEKEEDPGRLLSLDVYLFSNF